MRKIKSITKDLVDTPTSKYKYNRKYNAKENMLKRNYVI
jgi:hypothetical protein